jgi:RNA ligase (TIGR02306 family)
MEQTRKLASIRLVKEIKSIKGADAIELAVVDGWQVVTKKGEFKPGDTCVYFEIDSFLPVRDEFEFLRKSSFKKMGDVEGFRLKTIRLKGELSQGLLMPLNVLPVRGNVYLGMDVTEILGVIKYEPPIPAELAGKVKGYFPSFLRRTDEERVQNLSREYEEWKITSKHQFYATEKLDGSSASFYVKDGEFGVCSRNLELAEPGEFVSGTELCDDGIERPKRENTFWKVAREMDIKKKLLDTGLNLCIQGELIGEGIQKNPYKLKGHTVRFYNAFDIDKQERFNLRSFISLMEDLGFETVPILGTEFLLPDTIEELLQQTEGKSVLNPNAEREGLVIRSMDTTISFKVISNRFLLKNE